MAISVLLHISDDEDEDILIGDIEMDNIPDWIRLKRTAGGILCGTWKGTTPYIPFDEVKSFWFHDEDFVDTDPKPAQIIH